MFTPIHRALGLEPGDLTMNDINQVIAGKVEETADLDWKKKFYSIQNNAVMEEVAKDIAAMANSGGGWIVFGIKEDGENNAASSVNPIQWSADNERKILNVAYSKIGPPVVGVEFFKIPCGENPNEGYVVLMHVPDSADAPHFARKGDDAFRAPRRNGSHTVFMTDRDIERGFRERFQRGVEQEKTLQGYFEQATEALNPEQGVFLAIAAVPVTPKISAGPVDRNTVIQHTNPWAYSYFITSYQENHPKIPEMSTIGVFSWSDGDIVKGMRQWVLRNSAQAAAKYRKHLHDDGTLTGGYCLKRVRGMQSTSERHLAGEINHCKSIDVEKALIDFFSLLRAHAQERNVPGGFRIRVGLIGYPGEPIIIKGWHGNSSLPINVTEPEPIKRFQPVSTFIDPLAPIEDVLPPLRTLALDIVNQGNIQKLWIIADSE